MVYSAKLVVAFGGNPVFAEALDLKYKNRDCDDILAPDYLEEYRYDFPISYSTGGLLFGSIPFYCGGMLSNYEGSDMCFTAFTKRKLVMTLPTKRAMAASIVVGHHDSQLLITGGLEH